MIRSHHDSKFSARALRLPLAVAAVLLGLALLFTASTRADNQGATRLMTGRHLFTGDALAELRTQVAAQGLADDIKAVIVSDTTLAILIEYVKEPEAEPAVVVSAVRKKDTRVTEHRRLAPDDPDFEKLTTWFRVAVKK